MAERELWELEAAGSRPVTCTMSVELEWQSRGLLIRFVGVRAPVPAPSPDVLKVTARDPATIDTPDSSHREDRRFGICSFRFESESESRSHIMPARPKRIGTGLLRRNNVRVRIAPRAHQCE
jgi:hypothetical protein